MFSIGFMLKAESIEDVRLFLQVSSIIQKDFETIQGVPFCLALRKWVSIHPAAEFRCIVINNLLRGKKYDFYIVSLYWLCNCYFRDHL